MGEHRTNGTNRDFDGALAGQAVSCVYACWLLTNRDTQPLVLAVVQLAAGTVLLGTAAPVVGRQPVALTGTWLSAQPQV
jgi:hypothetical protein